MLALHFLGNGKSEVRDIPIPQPAPGEILLKVYASAICGSEKKSYFHDGSICLIPGHELAGEVVEANCTSKVKTGDHVTVNIMNGCGKCFYCVSGFPQFCPDKTYLSGGHAQYMAVPESCCVQIPKDIPYDLGVLLGGDTAGVAYRATSKLGFKKGETVYVIGAGPIGLGMTAFLKYLGAHVIVGEPIAYRRQLAKEKAGADLCIDPLAADAIDIIKQQTDGLGPKYIVECSGNPKAQLTALELVQCMGTVCFAGENYDGLTIVPSNHIIHKEIVVTGAFYFAPGDFESIYEHYHKGLAVEQLVSHIFPISQADKAFELFVKGETGKVLLHGWDE